LEARLFYELRRYQIQSGYRDDFVKYMEEVVIPYQTSKGMVVVGSFVDEKDPDVYFWMRRFENEEQRQSLYAATYEADGWKNEIAQSTAIKDWLLRDAMVVTRIVPTTTSPMR
jgi:NIPSNAP